MITKEKLEVYKYYDGNDDRLARASKNKQNIFKDNDWSQIASLIQDIFIVNNGLASDDFKSNLFSRLNSTCDSETTIKMLEELAQS